jgi:hypothetical protein
MGTVPGDPEFGRPSPLRAQPGSRVPFHVIVGDDMTTSFRLAPGQRLLRAPAAGLALAAALLSALPALAQPRPSTVNRPCASSQALVARTGAIVLGTGGYTFDRFVVDQNFCAVGEYTEPAWVPSIDNPQCFVGYRCVEGPRDLFGD